MPALPARHTGDPTGRRALLVHGLSSDSESWWRVEEALVADGWSVTVVDLRGHGSGPRTESYSLAEYAHDLPGDGWDAVVGHSLGGAVSVLAAQRPGFARALVLLDPVLEVPDELYAETVADQVSELGLTAESLVALKPHWHPRDRDAKLLGVQRVDPAAVERTFSDTGRWDVTAETTALTVPTLILAGDPAVYSMLAPATAQAIVAANPLVEYRVIEGAGHSPHRDRPDATLAALRDWLALH